MTPSPLELVASICAVIGLNVGVFYLLEALPKWLEGPRRTPALAGALLFFVVCQAVNTWVVWSAGHQALNFAVIGLLPAMEVTRIAPRVSPLRLQLALISLGSVGVAIGLLVLLRSMLSGAQDGWTWGLMTLFTIGALANTAWNLWKIRTKGAAA